MFWRCSVWFIKNQQWFIISVQKSPFLQDIKHLFETFLKYHFPASPRVLSRNTLVIITSQHFLTLFPLPSCVSIIAHFSSIITSVSAGPTDLSMKSVGPNSSSSSSNSHGQGGGGGGASAQLSPPEVTAVRQLIAGYRESAAFLLRSADELENLILQQNWVRAKPWPRPLSQPVHLCRSPSHVQYSGRLAYKDTNVHEWYCSAQWVL